MRSVSNSEAIDGRKLWDLYVRACQNLLQFEKLNNEYQQSGKKIPAKIIRDWIFLREARDKAHHTYMNFLHPSSPSESIELKKNEDAVFRRSQSRRDIRLDRYMKLT